MDQVKNFIQEQINQMALRYENSIAAGDFIKFKLLADNFIIKRTQAIREFYKSYTTLDRMSFHLKSTLNIEMRLVFYKSGSLHVYLEYIDSLKKFTYDKDIMSQFALDVGHVYFLESEFGWKIGKTKSLKNRMDLFRIKLPFTFALRYYINTHEKSKLEKYFHELFKERNINGEWFLISSDEIKEAVKVNSQLKLSEYSKDNKIFIDRKYLINEMNPLKK